MTNENETLETEPIVARVISLIDKPLSIIKGLSKLPMLYPKSNGTSKNRVVTPLKSSLSSPSAPWKKDFP